MKAQPFSLLWCLCTVLGIAGYGQCVMPFPPNGINLCMQGQPNISNTTTTITIPNPTSVPASGGYTVTFDYFSRTTGRCVGAITCSAASITASGSGFVIDLGGCANLPANFYQSPSMQINMVSNTGGSNYFFLYANRDCGIPLPIYLDYFRTNGVDNKTIELEWRTVEEINASHFIVERNSATDRWQTDLPLGRINAIYPNGGIYRFTDHWPLNGMNYYRLKMVDQDGSFRYADNLVWSRCDGCDTPLPLRNCAGVTMSGPNLICSTDPQVFSLSGVPYYSVCTWNIYSAPAVLSNTTGNSTTLTRTGDGRHEVYAQLTGCNTATRYYSKWVQFGQWVDGLLVGTAGQGGLWPLVNDGRTYYLPSNHYGMEIRHPDPGIKPPTWTLLSGNLTWWNYQNYMMEFYLPPGGYAQWQMDVETECGIATHYYYMEESGTPFVYSLAPNPVTSTLNISVDSRRLEQLKMKPSSEHTIQQIMVHDKNGAVVLQQKYAVNTKSISLNVAALKADVYTVRIFNGKKWEAKKFIKQ